MKNQKMWPDNCPWPKPDSTGQGIFDEDDIQDDYDDEELQELEDIKEYYDSLVKEGILDQDYALNGYEADEDWKPEKGEEYWEGTHFDRNTWIEDVDDRLSLLKIDTYGLVRNPVIAVEKVLKYEFRNENLLRQAFTRRSFAVQYGLSGDSEELEFFGDSIMNAVVTKELYHQFADKQTEEVEAPFITKYKEGELSRLRQKYISKEYLSTRASLLGLDEFILYADEDAESDSSREDMMEALIGAVAADSNGDEETLERIVNTLLDIQFDQPDDILKKSYYEIFNTWHQKHYGKIPEYTNITIYDGDSRFRKAAGCIASIIYYYKDRQGEHKEMQQAQGKTRSEARNNAAMKAYCSVIDHGAWLNLEDAGITPDPDSSINQLQELFQKKYVNEPVYAFEKDGAEWHADCLCNDMHGYGRAASKVKAKKNAAYMTLVNIFRAAGMDVTHLQKKVEW